MRGAKHPYEVTKRRRACHNGYAPPAVGGVASQSEYVTRPGPPGAPVFVLASPAVRSEITCCGANPDTTTDARVGPSSTGRRPVRSMARTACATHAADAAGDAGDPEADAGAPGVTQAVSSAAGSPHSSLTAGAYIAAVAWSVNSTLADDPMDAHSPAAAAAEPR